MKGIFNERESISRTLLGRLQRRDDLPATIRLSIQLSLIAFLAGVVFLFSTEAFWLALVATILIGLVQASLFAPLHECTHLTAFNSRGLNSAVAWLAGFAVLWSPAAYREFHFEHHRHTHDPMRDPEIALGGEKMANWPVYSYEYLCLASGLLLLGLRILMLCFFACGLTAACWQRFAPYVRPQMRRQIMWESRLLLLCYTALVVCAVTWVPGVGYLIVSLVVAHAVLALYLASEHTGCETSGNIFQRTRTILTNRFVRFFMWNMPYHAEHHAYPSVPFHALPHLHRALEQELVEVAPGYSALQNSVVSNLHLFPSNRDRNGGERIDLELVPEDETLHV